MTLSYFSPAGPPAGPGPGYITYPVACLACGQQLQGLHEGQRCPQCGLPVGRSAQPGMLRFAPPAWLGVVRSGLLLEFWAIIIGIIIGLIAVIGVIFWVIGSAKSAGSGGGPP